MKMPEEITRRGLFKGFAAAVAAVVVGEAANLAYHHFDESEEEGEMPDDVKGTNFIDGTIYSPAVVSAELTRWYKRDGGPLFKGLNFSEVRRLRATQLKGLEDNKRNYTKEGVPALMCDLEDRGILDRCTNKDDIKKSSLAYVEEVNELWRCRGIGSGASSTPKNDPRFLRMMPGAVKELDVISEAFQEKIQDAGLSSVWSVRIIVNSVLRTSKGTNNELSNASDDSPHTFGMAFDISNTRFDLIHSESRAFMMLGEKSKDGQDSRDAAILLTLNYLLVQVLEEEHARKRIVLTYEDKKNHYHITSLKP